MTNLNELLERVERFTPPASRRPFIGGRHHPEWLAVREFEAEIYRAVAVTPTREDECHCTPGRAYLYGEVHGQRDHGVHADGANPTLALLAALLRALSDKREG